MAKNEWVAADELLDTARKLVDQAEGILVRDGFSDSWTDELVCISEEIKDYLSGYRHAWIEEAPF